jgi:hypothetical protein
LRNQEARTNWHKAHGARRKGKREELGVRRVGRNSGIMEDWNNGENKTTEGACLVLFDPTFHLSSIPIFRNRLVDSPEF